MDLSRDLSRFDYPLTVPKVRTLNSRFVNGDKEQGVEHLVELAPDGVGLPAQWMPASEWRELVGMPSNG